VESYEKTKSTVLMRVTEIKEEQANASNDKKGYFLPLTMMK
jgi:hypothetical protein